MEFGMREIREPLMDVVLMICNPLCDLILFVQFKKHVKHTWRCDTAPWVFYTFLHTNGTKLRKASHIFPYFPYSHIFPCSLGSWEDLSQVNKILLGQLQQTFTCSKSTVETLEKGVKYVQN